MESNLKGALRSYLVHSFAKIGGTNPNRPHSRPTCLDYKVNSTYLHAGHEAIILHVTPYYQPFFRAFMPSMGRHLRATLMAQKGPSEHGDRGYSPSDFGRNRSKPFSYKKPWFTTSSPGFSGLPTAPTKSFLTSEANRNGNHSTMSVLR